YRLSTHAERTYTYSLSLHDALPIFLVDPFRVPGEGDLHRPLDLRAGGALEVVLVGGRQGGEGGVDSALLVGALPRVVLPVHHLRSEEHTSELQSRENLVCRLLLEKK